MGNITINGITLNTSAPKPALAALAMDNTDASGSDYVLVQPAHPLKADQREQLAQAGARILEAVPGGLVCHFPGTDLSKLRALPFVAWADVYPNVVKIGPSLLRLPAQAGAIEAGAVALAKPPALDAQPVTVDVVLHQGVDPQVAAQQVAQAAHLHDDEVVHSGAKLRLTLKRRRLADVANVDAVRHIEEVVARRLANNVARTVMRIESAAGGASVAFTGQGQVVAVADTGFDKGSTTDVHAAFKGRVKKLYALGRPNLKNDPHGHGTHVAGSVLGDGLSTADGPVKGAAPRASLVLQSVLDASGGLGGLPDNLEDLFLKPYRTDKARIHTNSWGSTGNFGKYDSQAREVDKFVHEHRDMFICFAAGNSGTDGDRNGVIDPGSVTPPGTAKNCLTVGASENSRAAMDFTYGEGWPGDFPAEPIKSDKVASNAEGVVAFSGRGPTVDQRIKPDVVAPGTYILSTRSRATKSEGWLLSPDPLYMYEGGTSMSTPLVAGAAALVREFLKTVHKKASPTAALMKALFINGAHLMAGQYVPSEAGGVPSNAQGFGRVDVQAIVGPYAANESIALFDEDRVLDTGESQDFNITVPAGAKRLKATLVWTDPPGEGLQSDLDLIVRAGNVERHGNVAPGSAAFDRTNNVEQVDWVGVPAGNVKVTVAAHSITTTPQSFALVVRIA